MAHAGAHEAVHTNGAVSRPPVSEPVAVLSTTEPVPVNELPPPAEGLSKSDESYEWVNKIGIELLAPRVKPRMGWRIPLVVGLVAGLILIAGLLYSGILQHYFESSAAPQTPTLASTAPVAAEPSSAPQYSNDLPALEQRAASKPNDSSALMDLGREYQRRKDWSKAEAAYRSALDASHANRDAALGLSDVLYQEQKYEESAAVLNKLSSTKSQ
jgi:cytochrome c-type biogenesis protein CcmH/NrfG